VIVAKKKPQMNAAALKGINKIPKLQHLNRQELYLAVGPGGKNNNTSRKSKIYSQNRQLTSKTEDIYNRDGGEYIRKITQRTNTKYSNFSEFPNQPVKERQVKLNPGAIQKFRSRTVKKRNKGTNKLGKNFQKSRQQHLKYYNIVTDLQKSKANNNKLC